MLVRFAPIINQLHGTCFDKATTLYRTSLAGSSWRALYSVTLLGMWVRLLPYEE